MNTPTPRTAGAMIFTAVLLCTLVPPTLLASTPASNPRAILQTQPNAASSTDATVDFGPGATDGQSSDSRIAAQYAALPMRFEPNVGQSDAQVQFLARGTGYTLFLTSNETVMVLGRQAAEAAQETSSKADAVEQSRRNAETAIVRTRFEGANAQPQAEGLDPLPGITNYFIGNVPSDWHTDIVSFSKVRYSEVYPGIDVVYYGNERSLEYDFVVSPGSDPSSIRLSIDGANRLSIGDDGELVLEIAGGELRQHAPVIYQEGAGGRELVAGGYVVYGDQVSFEVGVYDTSRPLVIDPVVVYSTYLGGSGLDQATSVAVSSTGAAYVAGVTGSANFPVQGTPTSTLAGLQDVFVTKMSLAGSSLTYSTYIGGVGTEVANDIVVDGAGSVFITGSTDSINYPVVTPTIAAQVGGTDAFLTKLTSAGNAIVYSTYWGSTGFEEGTGVCVDPANNAYISGNTSAPNFPTMTPFQAAQAGGMDAFMTKFSVAGNSIVYSTYLGGSADDRATDMTVADDAAVFVTGSTTSANFPMMTPSIQPALAGGRDAFLTHFSLAGNALLYSTYIGGSGDDEATGIVIDAPMNAYLTGRTSSTNFPTLTAFQSLYGGGPNDAFATKVSPSGNAIVYSTYLGGSGDDQGEGIAIDGFTNAFVTGSTRSANFPTLIPIQGSLSGVADAFVAKLNLAGNALVYSTYLGGVGIDEGQGIGIDLVGSAYVAGFTLSTDFPTVSPFQSAIGGGRDAFVTKIAEAPVVFGTDTVGVYSPSSGAFFLRNSNTSGPADLVFQFGVGGFGYVPLDGDWDGDGDDTIGLYEPMNGNFILKNSNSSGGADLVFGFGPSGLGWTPLVGDWNGDGVDTVGLYDPINGNFFLKNSHAPGGADQVYGFGPAGLGWLPLVGDWDGNGTDTVGLYDAANGNFFLRNAHSSGGADSVFGFGPGGLGWKPVTGDFDGNGSDSIGLYVPSSGHFFLKNSNTSGPADLSFSYGPPNLVPLIGDWDGL